MNIALVLAGGTGSRLGADIPKQYIEVGGKMIIDYCMETLQDSSMIDGIWIVCDESWRDVLKTPEKYKGVSTPGTNRQMSIYNGLKDIKNYVEGKNEDISECAVLIHDAARPNLKEKMISDCFDAVKEHDGALPVLPMKDTVYMSEDGKGVSQLLDRSKIYAGQAPECFRLDKYLLANEALMPDDILKINGSTEPAIMAGMDIAMIEGDEDNFKITTKADLERFSNEFVSAR